MHRLLVVANQTVVGTHVTNYVYELRQKHPELEVHVLVPATARETDPGVESELHGSDPSGLARATNQLSAGIEALRKVGARVQGEVGVHDPMQAVAKVMERRSFDQILVSTLPLGTSRWIKMDVPHRLNRRYGVPVEHLVGKSIDDWETHSHPAGETTRILLVEDNHDDVDLVKAALGGSNLKTELKVAAHGQRALDYIDEVGIEKVDLILLDLKMPVIDGHRFLELLGQRHDIDQMRIVVLTNSGLSQDRERAYALGARAYALKDPDFQILSETILSFVAEFAESTE